MQHKKFRNFAKYLRLLNIDSKSLEFCTKFAKFNFFKFWQKLLVAMPRGVESGGGT